MAKTSYIPASVEKLTIMNEPQHWSVAEDDLLVRTQSETDFWLKTHYGFEVMNGHVFYETTETDFAAEVSLSMTPRSTYDQAGLFVMVSENCWLKTSLEYIPEGPSHLGAVVTNHGYSDWSTQNYDNAHVSKPLAFRIERKQGDYTVLAKTLRNPDEWEQIRIAHLHEDLDAAPVKVGIYCCSPTQDGGFETRFHSFSIEKR
ncbi:DUF1349 domain-containing protein [Paenibacillus donghaensis]|uniref:DUF1349 domain-containing protein n=1 Tax=Paenibacillus donghaensis TaxID=414771 RepID=UPI0018847174|nr:DUF1349 domain-containing protein [Paenibacillus donghaensis]MBE9914309.1 DUF1349 domain-containing protein [Paenibacillus donghaensis]